MRTEKELMSILSFLRDIVDSRARKIFLVSRSSFLGDSHEGDNSVYV